MRRAAMVKIAGLASFAASARWRRQGSALAAAAANESARPAKRRGIARAPALWSGPVRVEVHPSSARMTTSLACDVSCRVATIGRAVRVFEARRYEIVRGGD